jgi:dTDP-4-amino-4,6-dideoxygalactose transaminase
MIPLAVPNLSGREAEYLQECVTTNFVSTVGPFVQAFEVMTADLTGFSHAVATNTGTSALHVAMKALGVQRDDLVVLPSYTFVATANAVRMCGAEPWLFDIDEVSWGLDPDLLETEFARVTELRDDCLWHKGLHRRIAAVVPVSAAGQPPRLKEIVDVASAAGIPLLVDAAGAAGVIYRDQSLGAAVEHAVLSFNGNKTFTAGGGGAFLTQDESVATRVRHLSTTARTAEDYSHDMEGFNYRITNVQAAVGCAQLEQAEDFLSRKRAIDAAYRAAWEGTLLAPFPHTEWAESSCWMTGAVLAQSGPWTVDEMVEGLAARGVQARGFWKPMHLQPPYVSCPRTDMTVTDDLWKRVIALPSSTSLTQEDQNRVIATVLELVKPT